MEASWRAEATNLQDLRNHHGQSLSVCILAWFNSGLGRGMLCCAGAGLSYVELLTYKTNLLPFRHSSREGK